MDGSASITAHQVAYGGAVALALVDLNDAKSIEWSIAGSSKSGESDPSITPAGAPLGATATFPVPSNPGDGLGRSWIVKCRVESLANGTSVTQYRVVGVPNGAGFVPLATGEELYRNATHGWTEEFNQALAGVTGDASQNTKAPARVATTANITLSGNQTIDGISVVSGNRVLVKNQSTASQNGIYVAAHPGAWARASDFDSDSDAQSGCLVPVAEGTAGAGVWQLSTPAPISLGSTSLTFSQIQGSGGGATAVPPVRLVATSNITLSGGGTVDGVTLANGNRVLAVAQSSGANNGIYVVNTGGAWSRATDFATAAQLEAASGAHILVLEGTRANTIVMFRTTGTITVGTTVLDFAVGFTGTTAANALKFPRVNAAGDNFDFVSSAGNVTARAVIVENVSHSGTLTYDGFALTVGMLVLDVGATSAATRGLWTVQSGSWTRPTETHSPGMIVTIADGAYGRGTQWQMAATQPFTIDVIAQTWDRTDGSARDGKVNTTTVSATLIRQIALPRGKSWDLRVMASARRTTDGVVNSWEWRAIGSTASDGTTTHSRGLAFSLIHAPAGVTAGPIGSIEFENDTGLLEVFAYAGATTSTDWVCNFRFENTWS